MSVSFSFPSSSFSIEYGSASYYFGTYQSNSLTVIGNYSFTSNNTNICTVSYSYAFSGANYTTGTVTLTPKNTGSCIINIYYGGSFYGQLSVTVAPARTQLTDFIITPENQYTYGTTPYNNQITIPTTTPTTNNPTGTFTYTVTDRNGISLTTPSSVISISGRTVTVLTVGLAYITATQSASTNGGFSSSWITVPFTVNPQPSTFSTNFTLQSGDTYIYGSSPYNNEILITNPVSNNLTGTFSYRVTDSSGNTLTTPSSVIDIYGNNVTVKNSGIAYITVTQEQNNLYTTNSLTLPFTVNPITTTFSTNFTLQSGNTYTYGSSPYNNQILITNPVSNNPIGTFSYSVTDSSGNTLTTPSSVIDIYGNNVTVKNIGVAYITVTQSASTNYTGKSVTLPFTVNQGTTTFSTNFTLQSGNIYIYGSSPYNNQILITNPVSNNPTGTFTYTVTNNSGIAVTSSVIDIYGNNVTVKNIGVAYITVTQSATTNYTSKSVTLAFTVNQATTTFSTNFTLQSGNTYIYGSSPYNNQLTITNPVSNNPTGTFTYRVTTSAGSTTTSSVISISGNNVTVKNTGVAYITVTQSATTNYTSKSVTLAFTVNQATTTFSTNFRITPDNTYTYGSSPYNNQIPITNPVSNNPTGTFTYIAKNSFGYSSSVITISGQNIIINKPGIVYVTCGQAGTTNYTSKSVTIQFTVNQITTIFSTNFTLQSGDTYIYGSSPYNNQILITNPISNNPTGTFYYSAVDSFGNPSSVISISGNNVTVTNAGIAYITCIQSETTTFSSKWVTVPFTVNKATTTFSTNFTLQSGDTYTYGSSPYNNQIPITNPVSNNPTGTFSYRVTDSTGNTLSTPSSVIDIYGNNVTVKNAGVAYITVTQSASTNYTSNTFTSPTPFTVNQATTTFSTNFTLQSGNIYIYGSSPYNNQILITNPVSNNPTGTFTYTVTDSTGNTLTTPSSVIDIYGNNVTVKNIGVAYITVTQSGTTNYTSKTFTSPTPFTVNIATTIFSTNFTLQSGDTYTYGSTPYNNQILITNPVSNNPTGTFTYRVTDSTGNTLTTPSSVIDIYGNNVTVKNAGVAYITVTQSGSTNYTSKSVTLPFTVNQATTIFSTNFTLQSGDTYTYGSTPYNNQITITNPVSNNPTGTFTYSVTDSTGNTLSTPSSVISISGNNVTVKSAGLAYITVTQSASTNYTSKTFTSPLPFIVNQATTTFSTNFTLQSGNTYTYGSTPYNNQILITNPVSNNPTGTFTYSVTDSTGNTLSTPSSVISISGNNVTVKNIGTAYITVTQSASTNYTSKTFTLPTPFTVNPITTVISNFVINSNNSYQYNLNSNTIQITNPTSNSTAPFTYYTSDGSGNVISSPVIDISGNKITVKDTGYVFITARQLAYTVYSSALSVVRLNVIPITPVITKPFYLTNGNGPPPYSDNTTTIDRINNGSNSANLYAYLDYTITPITTLKPLYQYYNIVNPLSSSPGTVTYTSSDPTIIDISFNRSNKPVIFIKSYNTNKRSIVISATQNAYTGYSSVTTYKKINIDPRSSALYTSWVVTTSADPALTPTNSPTIGTFTINGNNPYVFGSNEENKIIFVNPTSNSSGTFTYTSSNPAVATILGRTITVTGCGSTIITATQSAFDNYSSGSVNVVLNVSQKVPSLGNFTINGDNSYVYKSGSTPTPNPIPTPIPTPIPIPTPTPNNTITIVNPTSNSLGTFTYTSSNPAVANISGNTINVVGCGTTTITATQYATNNYSAASISTILTVTPTPITFGTFTINGNNSYNYGSKMNNQIMITPPSSDSLGTFTYTSSNNTVATISGNTINVIGPGVTTITATQPAYNNYLSGSISVQLNVNVATPIFGNFIINGNNSYVYGSNNNNTITITNPTSNSPGTFTYTSSDSSIATVSGNVLTVVCCGNATITATQSASTNYLSGTISTLFNIFMGVPTIGNFTISNMNLYYFGSNPNNQITITNPTSNSSGNFTYTSSNTSIATVSGNVLTVIGCGTTTITATQSASSIYTPNSVTATLKVNPGTPQIGTFVVNGNNSYVSTKTSTNRVTITNPPSNSSGQFTYSSSNTAVAVISGNMLTVIGGGNTTITATQSASGNYTIGQKSINFSVTK